eukprot:m.155954 g.155954  ORF g.155954 m.155954 type:complete len:78 (+) comp38682_c0_seq16:44-277(+)
MPLLLSRIHQAVASGYGFVVADAGRWQNGALLPVTRDEVYFGLSSVEKSPSQSFPLHTLTPEWQLQQPPDQGQLQAL